MIQERHNLGPDDPLPRVAGWCGLGAVLLGLLGASAWVLRMPFLWAMGEGYVPMASFTAALFILLGGNLWLLSRRPWSGAARAAALAVVWACLLTSVLGLLSVVTGWRVNPEDLASLYTPSLGDIPLNRMSPMTAALFALTAASQLLLMRPRRFVTPAGILGLVNAVGGFFGVVGYLYGTPILYGAGIIPMAATTSLAFLLLGGGLVAAAGTDFAPMRPLVGASPRARILRAFLPLTLLLVLVHGFIETRWQNLANLNHALWSALVAIGLFLVTVLVALRVARQIGASIEKTEADLLKSRQENAFLADLFKVSSQPLGVGYPDGTLGVCNPAFLNLVGYTREELARKNWARDLTPQRWLTLEQEKLAELAATGRPVRYEKEYIRQDGTLVPVELLVHLTRNDDGKPQYYYAFATDITERKASEAALRRSEETHRALVAGLPDMVARYDRQGRHLFVSREMKNPRGLAAVEFLGKTHRELGFPDDICDLLEDAIAELFDSGAPHEAELSVPMAGDVTIYNWRLVPELDDQGRVHQALAIIRDVTAHRQVERNYQMLFHEMLDGFALHEMLYDGQGRPADYRFLAVNPAFEGFTGLRAEDLIGKTVLEVMPGTERHWIETYGQVAQTGEPVYFENYSGELDKYFEVRAFRPGPNQFACIFTEISARKRAEAQEARLQEQLRQAQKMEAIGTLAGGVAHDFNNILGAVIGYAELAVSMGRDGESNIAELVQLLKAAERARDLVKQILTFSRKVESDRRPLNLNSVVGQVLEILRRTLPKMIDIQTRPGRQLSPVMADANQMEQVILNLATNAADAMPEGGLLTLETENVMLDEEFCRHNLDAQPGPHVLLKVSDSGHGMDRQTMEQIFNPFFTTKEVGKGTGLGLSMVHGIVRGHGGVLLCDSEPGRGTTFRIYLPAEAGTPAAGERQVPQPPEQYRGHESILLVDDDADLRNLGKRSLEDMGYRVLTAASGEEALDLFRERGEQLDLVILDLGMPGMGGSKCLRAILALNPRARIIVASGYNDEAHITDCTTDGAKAYVTKPYRRLDLLGAIRTVLDG